jgi:hypothetical protein
MDHEIQQLVEMVGDQLFTICCSEVEATMQGATPAQARAALKQYKDVNQAAERFFEGAFDHIVADEAEADRSTKPLRKAQVAVSAHRHLPCILFLIPI